MHSTGRTLTTDLPCAIRTGMDMHCKWNPCKHTPGGPQVVHPALQRDACRPYLHLQASRPVGRWAGEKVGRTRKPTLARLTLLTYVLYLLTHWPHLRRSVRRPAWLEQEVHLDRVTARARVSRQCTWIGLGKG